jgi:hypothetical protein
MTAGVEHFTVDNLYFSDFDNLPSGWYYLCLVGFCIIVPLKQEESFEVLQM